MYTWLIAFKQTGLWWNDHKLYNQDFTTFHGMFESLHDRRWKGWPRVTRKILHEETAEVLWGLGNPYVFIILMSTYPEAIFPATAATQARLVVLRRQEGGILSLGLDRDR